VSLLDDALAAVSDRAKVVGLWLATHPEIPSLGPTSGPFLLQIAQKAAAALASEQDPMVKQDVSRFILALVLVSHSELVHGTAIITQLEQMLAGQVEAPDAP